jgi:hypothetical protein
MDEIFYLMRHGGGGFSWVDCYNMPTQVRKYNVRKLSAEIKEENEKAEAARAGKNGEASMKQMAKGNVKGFEKNKQPDYKAKAPSKR